MIINCQNFAPVWEKGDVLRTFTDGSSPPDNVNFAFSSSTCYTSGALDVNSSSTTISSSTAPLVYNGFTYGEIVATTFLFLIFITLAFRFIFEWIRGIKIKKQY